MVTKKAMNKLREELKIFKKKGYSNRQILRLYAARYGLPEYFVLELYEFLLSNEED